MSDNRHSLHHRSKVDINADTHSLFAFLDDHRRLAAHMEKPSKMMASATVQVETDSLKGQAVGSLIRITGRVLGVSLVVDEVVTERVPPLLKIRQTRGQPRLLVIGSYCMGFAISAKGDRSHLEVFIDYRLPTRGFDRLLARIFGRYYAAWCTRRIAADAAAAFGGIAFQVT